jgi:hypothetical protein
MPIKMIDVNLEEYFMDDGFEEGSDTFGMALECMTEACDSLDKYFRPLGYLVEEHMRSPNTGGGNQRWRITLNKKGSTIVEVGDIEEGTPEHEAFEKAKKEFEEAIETDYEKVARSKLSELPLLLGSLETKEAKRLAASRLQDPITVVRRLAEEAGSVKELVKNLKRYLKEG